MVGADESSRFRIVVSADQVVQLRFAVIVVRLVSERIYVPYERFARVLAAVCVADLASAPCVILILRYS